MRSNFAVISQSSHLFNTTVEENINLDGKASKDDIEIASKISGAYHLITNWEDKNQHKLGLNGEKLYHYHP